MRTTTASIHFTLKQQKAKDNGECPIYLVVSFKGRKEQATGIYCKVKDWNERTERLKATAPHSTESNKRLDEIFTLFNDRRITLQNRKGSDYSYQDIFCNVVSSNATFNQLIEAYIDDHVLKISTQEHYTKLQARLLDFIGEDCQFEKLNLRKFANYLEARNNSDSSINLYLSRLSAIAKWALRKGYISTNPFDDFSDWRRQYKLKNRIQRLTKPQVDYVEKYLSYIFEDVTLYTLDKPELPDDVKQRILGRSNRHFALVLWYFIYRFQGLAPADCFFIKKKDIEVKKWQNKEYYCLNTKRSKTGEDVLLRVEATGIIKSIVEYYLENNPTDYLLPCYQNKMTDSERHKALRHTVGILDFKLRTWSWQEVNKLISKDNQWHLEQVHLIDEKCTLYSARHTFATLYINQPSTTVGGLAKLLGRSVNKISDYIHALEDEDELMESIITL